MKFIIFNLFLLLSFNSFAGLNMKADEIIDRGSYVEVINPFIHGCVNGNCYGGAGDYWLTSTFRSRKICRDLGFKKAIQGSRVVEDKMISLYYSPISYHLIQRAGPPGSPEVSSKKVITYIECKKY